MDIVSHGLWGGIVFGRKDKRTFLLSFLFGIAPDALSFGVFFIAIFLGLEASLDFSDGRPADSEVPFYVHYLYSWTHSVVVFAVAFLALWALQRRPVIEFLAWGLHIAVDIPTHDATFFPTPFLWPIADVSVSGIPWIHPIVFIPNIVALAGLYYWFFYRKNQGAQVRTADLLRREL
ncbi:MAG: hypothetical protein A3I44_06225 [Candidatus Sungbacteria bacterium RIFCSPLOWO2_02_FULL_51_17]|nr:MAG: hypothetical protein A3I44_06225 [Candidatus Sungbacteria bacterium RIFCSPLOWO2_02_FULL_51_17]